MNHETVAHSIQKVADIATLAGVGSLYRAFDDQQLGNFDEPRERWTILASVPKRLLFSVDTSYYEEADHSALEQVPSKFVVEQGYVKGKAESINLFEIHY